MLDFRTIFVGTILLFLGLVAGPYVAVQIDYSTSLNFGFARFLGVPLMFFGAPLAVWATLLVLFGGRTKNSPDTLPNSLVSTGPYKRIRNPVMLGWLCVLWGEVLFIESVALLIYGIVLTLCIHFWVLAFEEPYLEDKYGDEFKTYMKEVPRWLPKIRRKSLNK